MIEAIAEVDWHTSKRAGAGGMFQVISLTNTNGGDLTKLIDPGQHFATAEEVAEVITNKTGKPATVTLED